MSRLSRSLLLLGTGLTLAVGCSGGSGGEDTDTGTDLGTSETGGNDAETDAPDASPSETGGEDGTDAPDAGDTTTDTGSPWDPATVFNECIATAECEQVGGRAQECVNSVCVIPPANEACLAEEEDDQYIEHCGAAMDEPEVGGLQLGCFRPEDPDYLYLPAEGPETLDLSGEIDRFGSGSPTNGLCVSFYDENLALPFLYFSECRAFEGQDDDMFIACFNLDACRCQQFFESSHEGAIDDMVEAAEEAWGDSIDDLDACYTFIGYCAGIEDAGARADCAERVQTLTYQPEAETLIYGAALSEGQEGNPDIGRYTIEDMPTNTRLTIKVSGRSTRWRDTWEYGIYVRADRDDDHDGNVEPSDTDGVFELTGNAVGDGAWRTIPPAVGISEGVPETHGALAGSIRDCGVNGTRPAWQITHATVGISFDARKLAYFNGNPNDTLPLPGREDTNGDGTYAAIDLPSGPNRVSPIVLVGGEYFYAGSRNIFQTPFSIIIATFEGINR